MIKVDASTVISILISALGVGGVISGIIGRKLTRAEEKNNEREKERQQETELILKGIKAAGELSLATAIALKRGHANGEVEKGIESFESFNKDMENFLISAASRGR